MTTDKRGVSALLLQRQLGLGCYETAWMMLHKFRRAMVDLEREPLRDEVEVDDTWIGGAQAGMRGSRQLKGRKAALVIVAVEKRGKASGRIRMASSQTSRASLSMSSSSITWLPVPRSTRTGSKASPVLNKPDSGIFHAPSLARRTSQRREIDAVSGQGHRQSTTMAYWNL
jgi:hypothetical protein